MRVAKVFNNNVVLAIDAAGGEVVLTGRGLGFQAAPGQPVVMERVQRTFVPDAHQAAAQLAAFLVELPPESIAVADEILIMARQRLGFALTQGMVIPLADHLSFAAKRTRQGIRIDYPLRAEVAHLYPEELAVAREGIVLASLRLGVELASDEAVPLALHFVNAQFASDDLSRTFQMTELFRQIFEVLESAYGHGFDRDTINAARFVTHLRYFFVRAANGKQLVEDQSVFASAIRAAFPAAHRCAERLRAVLALRLGTPVTEDEVTYLTLHIARLASELADAQSAGADAAE